MLRSENNGGLNQTIYHTIAKRKQRLKSAIEV